MENDARELMAEVERAEAAPYIHYPPTPWWYGPYFGLYFVGLVLALAWARNLLVYFPVLVALLGSLFLMIRHMKRRNGVLPMPGRGNPPPEIARVYRRYFWSLLPVGAVLLACWFLLPPVSTAAVAFATVTGGFVVYDRYYGRAAAAARERLS